MKELQLKWCKTKLGVLDESLTGKVEEKKRRSLTEKQVYQRTGELQRPHPSFQQFLSKDITATLFQFSNPKGIPVSMINEPILGF